MHWIDMHCDTLSEIWKGNARSLKKNGLCVDLDRLRQNGAEAQFFACFVNARDHAGEADRPEKGADPSETGRGERILPGREVWDLAYRDVLEMVRLASSAEDAICSVKMRRTRGPFHPMVRSGKVDAAYFMVDNAGDTIEDSVVAQTRQNGSFDFPATNPYMVRRGSIIFSIHLPEDTIEEIERKAGKGFLDPLLSLRAEKSIVFDYVLPDRFPHAEALIAIVPFMRGDSPVYATETLEAFKGQLDAVGVGYDIVLAAGEDEGDILSRLHALYPEKRYLIISYLGVTDHREAFDGYYARVDGRSLIMDRDSLLVEQEIFASDGDESVEEAELNALEKGARIAAGMLLKDI